MIKFENKLFAIFLSFLLILPVFSLQSKINYNRFPIEGDLRSRVNFWKKVYTEVGSGKGFLHDEKDLDIIHETISFPSNRRRKIRKVRARKREIRNKILRLLKLKKEDYLVEDEALFEKLKFPSRSRLKEMAYGIRFQGGMADGYKIGVKRSELYIKEIKTILREEGVPVELAYLPHVESSFNYLAYSKMGAAGIWQFMRPTARLYRLKMNYLIDQRRDPLLSTRAAARLLKDNYRKFQSWPLAITAYNHGPASVGRAVNEVGTKNIAKIIKHYKGRRFGFASKNFYATFMAALELSWTEHSREMGNDFQLDLDKKFVEVSLPKAASPSQIEKELKISRSRLKSLNLSLRPMVFRSDFILPKGYKIRIPLEWKEKREMVLTRLNKIKQKKYINDGTMAYKIKRGESLYWISKKFNVPLRRIIASNNLVNPSTLYPGQLIHIPVGKNSKAPLKKLFPSVTKKVAEVKKTSDKTLAVFKKKPEVKIAKDKIVSQMELRHYNLKLNKVAGGTFKVQVEVNETLGHYSDWAGIPLSALRRMNNYSPRKQIRVGSKVKIILDPNKVSKFNRKRFLFHQSIHEDFYNNFKINGLKKYVVKRGDTIDGLTKNFGLPLWLIRKYQRKQKGYGLFEGQVLNIPTVVALQENI